MASLCLNCSTFQGAPSSEATDTHIPCTFNFSNDPGIFSLEDLNLTNEELKLKYLGLQQHPHFASLCTTYLLIFVVGVLGNALTCFVIAHHKNMRTPTNYFLFSLAVSDLLVLLVGLPLELYEMWQNYPYLLGLGGCYFRTLLFETVCLASVLNVTALSVERYVAVVHPLRARSLVTRAHVRRVLAAIWSGAVLCSLPKTSLHGIQELVVPCRGPVPGSSWCIVVGSQSTYNLVVQVTALLFFFLPMTVISVLYVLIGRQLQREQLLGLQLEAVPGNILSGQSLQERGRMQVTKMLFVLVVVFCICWAPFHTERLLWSFVSTWTNSILLAYQHMHIFSGVLLYLSSAANPVLYSLMSTRFRETFQEALECGRRADHSRAQSLSRVTTGTTLSEMGSLRDQAPPSG